MSVSTAERNALSAWAKLHGGHWKQALCFAWQNAEYPGVRDNHAATLQTLEVCPCAVRIATNAHNTCSTPLPVYPVSRRSASSWRLKRPKR